MVADRLRSVARDRYRFVEPDVSAPIVVLASAGPHAELAAAYLERGRPRGVDVGVEPRRARPARARRSRPRRRRQPRRRRRRLARPERPVRPPPRRIDERVRRAPRHRPRHRRPGLRPRAPPLVPRLGDRLARRALDRAARRQRPRAVLVPRAGRRPRQLPRRDARSVAAAPQLPGRAAHQRPAVGDASRPGHGAAADAQSAAPRGRRRGVARRGARRGGVGRAGDRGDRHGRADRHRGVGRRRRLRRPARPPGHRAGCRHGERSRTSRRRRCSRPSPVGGVRLQAFTGIPHTG